MEEWLDMIKTEYYTTRSDGVVLNRTYSDLGYMIERNGMRYAEAIDPAELKRQYTETDEPANDMSVTEEKALAYDILMGVTK